MADGGMIFAVVMAVLVAFLFGSLAVLLLGGRTALHYLQVKAGRGKKVLLFVKTKFGWRSRVATKDENLLRWKIDKQKRITAMDEEQGLTRYARVDMVFVNLESPFRPILPKDGEMFPQDFDPEVYNNLLLRALTRPSEGLDELKKLIQVCIAIGVLVLLGIALVYFKINELTGGGAAAATGVI